MTRLYTSGEYLAAHPTWHAEDSPWKASQIISMLRKHEMMPKSVVEIGCGAGVVLYELSQHMPSAEFTGYDISPQAIDMARRFEFDRVRFLNDDLLLPDNTEHFDLLLCIDVFEHIPDYMAFLRGCLTKAESFLFHIPLDIHVSSVFRNSLPRARQSLGHLHYFTDSTAMSTLTDCGYRILDYRYTESAMSLFWKHPSLRRAAANVPRFVVSKLSVPLCARLLGGYSLLVLCN